MIKEHDFTSVKWFQLLNPTADEIREIIRNFEIDPSVAQDIASPTPKQKIETYSSLIYAVFHIPAYKHTHSESRIQELDLLIGKDYIITVQYDTIDALHKFSKETDVNTFLKKHGENITPGIIFLGIMRELYNSVNDEFLHIGDRLKEIEQNIFQGKEKEMVFELSAISRDLLDLKMTLLPHENNFEDLMLIASKARNNDFLRNIKAIYENGYSKIKEKLVGSIDLVAELRETNNSLLSTKQNEIMKILTIMAFVTLPLSLIADIFGMSTGTAFLSNISRDFLIVIIFMLLVGISMFILFKMKKWL